VNNPVAGGDLARGEPYSQAPEAAELHKPAMADRMAGGASQLPGHVTVGANVQWQERASSVGFAAKSAWSRAGPDRPREDPD